VIFSDGIENDFLGFNSGLEVTVGLSRKMGLIAVWGDKSCRTPDLKKVLDYDR
jgi:hypothetical protein